MIPVRQRALALAALATASVVCGPSQAPNPPAAPAWLTAFPADGRVALAWPPVGHANGYVVYVATAGGVGPATWSALPGSSRTAVVGTALVVPGLANGVSYHFAVTATGDGGEGEPSPEASAAPERDCACLAWQVCNASRVCVPAVGPGRYLPAVNYHALSDGWMSGSVATLDDVFLPAYHLPEVRAAVRGQLAAIAAAGAKLIKTAFWPANLIGISDWSYALDFPPTAQQLANLRAYVEDVAATPTPDGEPLELYLSNNWDGASSLDVDTPATTLGMNRLKPADFAARVTATHDGVLAAIRGVYRSDGRPAVTLVYGVGEFSTCATEDDTDPVCTWPNDSRFFHNSAWFMRTFHSVFVAKARAAGVIPSVYFLILGVTEANVLDPSWRDPWLRAVDGHLPLALAYRALRFMKLEGLPIPDRIDFTTGFAEPAVYTTSATVLAREYDDVVALLPEFQAPPLRFGAAEVIYWADPSVRMERGKPFASEALLGRGLEYAAYWPEPAPTRPPYDMKPLETRDVEVPFASLDPGFEDLDSASGLPAGWAADPEGPTSAVRAVVADAHGGSAVLRLDGRICGGCGGVRSAPVPVTPGRTALVRFWARSSIAVSGGRPPASDYAGMTVEVRGSSGGVDAGRLLEFGTVGTAGTWRRFVGVLAIPPAVDALRLRFALQNAGTGVVDIDDLH